MINQSLFRLGATPAGKAPLSKCNNFDKMFAHRAHRVFVMHFTLEKLIGVFIINTSGLNSGRAHH